ncbi:hypothetical protein ACFQ0K_00930 [Nocardioides caeni]|uniref:DUF2567 domain-containing protein n=1 Tax=Nocardioides caeni TaxID=574700 RepID=A0A4S8NNR7_9ACTN|nr:hypothetical protein [Nocardioides caeni]THV18560.1 hypothetical protein E9934_02820 [Nocardioides caeni]
MQDIETGRAAPDAVGRARAWALPVAVPLALGAALGGLGGWLWWRWWGPAPSGQIYDTVAGPAWYPNPFDPGITADFKGTATFVVIGVGLALALGIAAGLWARNNAIPGLVGVLLASVLGAGLMTWIGQEQSPPDPQEQAAKVEIGTKLPGHLEIASHELDLPDSLADAVGDDDGIIPVTTPWLVWPVGALLGYLVVMLALATTAGATLPSDPRAQHRADPAESV